MTTLDEQIRNENIERLRKLCPPGTRVYTLSLHVSQSGMLHVLGLYVIHDNELVRLTGMVSTTFSGYTYNRTHEGLVMRGVGYSHGRALVDHLASDLYGDMNALKHESI